MSKEIENQLKELSDFFEIETTMDHFNTQIHFKFINKFDKSISRYKIDFWEIQNGDMRAKEMISELRQIAILNRREILISKIL